MKRKSAMAIGMVVFCFMMMASGAVWAENKVPIPPNGSVLDTNTGLVWLQNANCFGVQTWDTASGNAASLKSGSCGLTDGSTAGKWRLPTVMELRARANSLQGFNNVQTGYYWSSGHADSLTSIAWFMGVGAGYPSYYVDKSYTCYVWPVRAGL